MSRALVAALLATALGAAFACSSSYAENDATDGGAPDAAITQPGPGDAATGPNDASTPDAGLECTLKTLYVSSGAYLFDIATDANYVYFVEQRAPGDAYNGAGVGSVLRVDRTGAFDASRATALATSQSSAQTLALDGLYVYFATFEANDAGGYAARLKRVARDCPNSGCAVEDVLVDPQWTSVRLVRLVRAAPGVFFATGDGGQIFRIALGSPVQQIAAVGYYASLTATDRAVYFGGGLSPKVQRVTPDGVTLEASWAQVPPLDDAGTGLYQLATDCDTLYGARTRTTNRGDALVATSLAAHAPALLDEGTGYAVFDLAADARWLYVAAPNAGGFVVVDPRDGGIQNVAQGNVFRLVGDDKGVYFGLHDGSGKLAMMVK